MSLLFSGSWFAANWAQAIVALTSTGTFGVAVNAYATFRKAKTADRKTDADAHAIQLQVEADADTKLRDHYAAELQSLRDQLSRSSANHIERTAQAERLHQESMAAAEERHNRTMRAADEREAACHENVKTLREYVERLSAEVLALRRNIVQVGRSAIVLASESASIDGAELSDRTEAALSDQLEQLRAIPHPATGTE